MVAILSRPRCVDWDMLLYENQHREEVSVNKKLKNPPATDVVLRQSFTMMD